jgi:hypothetical protein
MTKLVAKLKGDDLNWAEKTVFLLDNASYHKDVGVLNQMML